MPDAPADSPPLPAQAHEILRDRPVPLRDRVVIWCVLAVVFLGGTSARWVPSPDSGLYLSLGRSIAEAGRYDFNGQLCTDVTPGLPVILAGIRGAFGEVIWPANLAMVLAGLGALALTGRVISQRSGPTVALLGVLAVGLSYKYFRHSTLILTEAPSVLCYAGLLWVLLVPRGQLLARALCAAAVTAACIAIRVPMVGLLAVTALGLVFDKSAGLSRTGRLVLGGVVLAVAIAGTVGFFAWSQSVSEGESLYLSKAAEVDQSGGVDVIGRLGELGTGLVRALPETLAELVTGQDGTVAYLAMGLPLAAMGVVGLVSHWRRGSRLIPIACVGLPVVSAVSLGAWAVKSRYLMPVQLMWTCACVEGLAVIVALIGRRLRGAVPGRAVVGAAIALVVVAVGMNLPRLARRVYWLSYLSRTDRFYDEFRAGRHADLPEMAALLRSTPPEAVVLADAESLRYFHWIGDRVIVPLPLAQASAEDAARTAEVIGEHPRAARVILDLEMQTPAFTEAIRARLQQMGFTHRATLSRYEIYLPPASKT